LVIVLEGLRICSLKEPLSSSDRNTSSHSIIKETVVPRSQARISHAPNISTISSTGSLDWEMLKIGTFWIPVSIWQASHISPYVGKGNAGKSWCLGFKEIPGEFQLAESPRMASHWWLTMVYHDWLWFTYHKWFLRSRVVPYNLSLGGCWIKPQHSFTWEKELSYVPEIHLSMVDSFCACR